MLNFYTCYNKVGGWTGFQSLKQIVVHKSTVKGSFVTSPITNMDMKNKLESKQKVNRLINITAPSLSLILSYSATLPMLNGLMSKDRMNMENII